MPTDLFAKLLILWNWFIDALSIVVVACRDHFSPPKRLLVRLGDDVCDVFAADGILLGSITRESEGWTSTSPVQTAFENAHIDLALPEAWILRRSLQPIAAESLPFVEALARHQIERLTPWRVADTYFGVRTEPFDDDPARLRVEVAVVARTKISHRLTFFRAAQAANIRLLVLENDATPAFVLSTKDEFDGENDTVKLRRRIGYGLAASLLLIGFGFGLSALEYWRVGGEIETLDEDIARQRALLRPPDLGTDMKVVTAQSLRRRHRIGPCVTGLLEALSDALPDHAYIDDFALEKGALRISGTSRNVADLVPRLEGTKFFSEVGFAGATTREEGGVDRFHLEMHIVANSENRCS